MPDLVEELLRFIAEGGCSGALAHTMVRRLHARDRWSTFRQYAETIDECARELREFGLEVEEAAFPADGKTKFGDWMMPLAWDVDGARLEVDGPEPRVLADYAEVPQSLVMWSAPTAPGGVTAEVICLERGAPAEVEGLDARGRILFTPGHPTEIKAAAARAGAVGIVSDWTRARGMPDVRQWINSWSDTPGGWAMHATDSRLWGFTLTPREGDRLRAEVAGSRTPLRLRAEVRTGLYEGELHYTTGAIRGTTDEEVLLMAHVNEQGGNDNAAGASALIEAARVLSQLIARGALPAPRRTLRFLLMPESYGTMAYVVRERERLARTTVALNVDSGAGAFDHEDSVLEIFANPHCCPNLADAALVAVVQAYYAAKGRPDKWRLKRYSLAGDNFFCDPLIGVPHPWLAMGDGGDFWHNTGDTPERVDPESLTDLCRIVAANAYLMASAAPAELEALAQVTRASLPPESQELLRLPTSHTPYTPHTSHTPRRSCIGALTLDGVPPERWGSITSSPRWWGPQLAAWWWADGRRSVSEIAALVEQEFGRTAGDLAGFFETLADLGYVRSVER